MFNRLVAVAHDNVDFVKFLCSYVEEQDEYACRYKGFLKEKNKKFSHVFCLEHAEFVTTFNATFKKLYKSSTKQHA